MWQNPQRTTELVTFNEEILNPIQDGHFWGCSRMGGGEQKDPLPKICHTYPTTMKLGSYTLPKQDPKNT